MSDIYVNFWWSSSSCFVVICVHVCLCRFDVTLCTILRCICCTRELDGYFTMRCFVFDCFCTSKFVVRNLTEPSSIWNTMHTRPLPYKAQRASTQKLNEHIKIIQLIQNLPEPHVYSTRSQDLALSDLWKTIRQGLWRPAWLPCPGCQSPPDYCL